MSLSGSPLRRNDSELVDELAFGGNGLGARTVLSRTSGILGFVLSSFATAGTVGAIASGIDRGNKWLTINQISLAMHMTR